MAVLNHQFSHLVFLFVYGIVRVRLARKEASALHLAGGTHHSNPVLEMEIPKGEGQKHSRAP
ncbi:MAG TPA: hypothetical protein H9950_04975 [Candidatus Bacteroides avicola]|uniref:Uncharacterized protein n=1 Tax=Candidatus Bacteroides avicola TaxID=2838468 RepID=A0A9D2KUY9_9BACE|nr:hypothetical protein [Candidatus Bacteroides avicola]